LTALGPNVLALDYRAVRRRVIPGCRRAGSCAPFFDNLEKLARVTAPTSIAHRRADERVPFEQGERLFAAAPARKQALWLDEAEHGEVYSASGRPLAAGLMAFFQTLTP
jgi:pimeloyl-ACP methyl ester carboxylesterase